MSEIANGPFEVLIKEFVDFKQATGFKYQKEYSILKQFDNYCVQQQITEAVLTKDLSDGWCEKRLYENPRTNDQKGIDFASIRVFTLCQWDTTRIFRFIRKTKGATSPNILHISLRMMK